MIKKIILMFVCILLSSQVMADNAALTAIKRISATKQDVTQETVHKKIMPLYAIVLFFRSTCPHCQRFVPIIKRVAKAKGLPVYPYSTDGGALPAYPTPLIATPSVSGTFFTGVPNVVPSVFLINTKTMAFTLVSQGEETDQELGNQLDRLVKRGVR